MMRFEKGQAILLPSSVSLREGDLEEAVAQAVGVGFRGLLAVSC